jgi:hypothetical protein
LWIVQFQHGDRTGFFNDDVAGGASLSAHVLDSLGVGLSCLRLSCIILEAGEASGCKFIPFGRALSVDATGIE